MTVTRRDFLLGTAAGLVPFGPSTRGRTERLHRDETTPFTLGVASGDPDSSRVVLWTRIAPKPLDDQYLKDSVPVSWSIARDSAMQNSVAKGVTHALPSASHCVHIDVDGLEANTEYYYRFTALGYQSPIGRTHTLPNPDEPVDDYKIAVVSCQNYSAGFFTAYRDIVLRQPDMIIHLGDYIYESGGGDVRPYPVQEAMTLTDYRSLYAQYRLDPDLQDAHLQFPWMLIWDDHEVVNDWGPSHYLPSSYNKQLTSHDEYLVRKQAAIQAYMEYMPIRRSRRDLQNNTRIYDRSIIGNLIELNRLDVRSYRDEPVCDLNERKHFTPCVDTNDSSRSLLGSDQETWLIDGLGQSRCTWNCLVQATVMAPLDLSRGDSVLYEADSWDNYESSRDRIADAIVEKDLNNVVSLGGNIHAFYAGIMYDRQKYIDRKPILTEIVTTSIAAPGGDHIRYNDINGRLHENPGISYFENRYRGYVWLDLSPTAIHADLRVVDDINHPQRTVRTLTKLKILEGQTGVVEKTSS